MKWRLKEEIRRIIEEENSPPPQQASLFQAKPEINNTTKTPTMTDFSIDAILGNSANATTTTTYNNHNHSSSIIINTMTLVHAHNTLTPPITILTPPSVTNSTTPMTTPGSTTSNCNNSNTTASKRPRPKKYKCPYCWVALSNTGQFRGHIRIHTGERPFKCDQPFCMKTFTRNEELTRHKRIHTGQRPYACDLCKKCFGRKDHLKKHMRTHERHALDLIKQSQQQSVDCGGGNDYGAALGTLEQLNGEKTQDIIGAAYWSLTPERFSL